MISGVRREAVHPYEASNRREVDQGFGLSQGVVLAWVSGRRRLRAFTSTAWLVDILPPMAVLFVYDSGGLDPCQARQFRERFGIGRTSSHVTGDEVIVLRIVEVQPILLLFFECLGE